MLTSTQHSSIVNNIWSGVLAHRNFPGGHLYDNFPPTILDINSEWKLSIPWLLWLAEAWSHEPSPTETLKMWSFMTAEWILKKWVELLAVLWEKETFRKGGGKISMGEILTLFKCLASLVLMMWDFSIL